MIAFIICLRYIIYYYSFSNISFSYFYFIAFLFIAVFIDYFFYSLHNMLNSYYYIAECNIFFTSNGNSLQLLILGQLNRHFQLI